MSNKERNYNLLRPATLEYVKAGGKICWCEDSDIAETFITSDDKIVTVFKGELRAGIWDGNDVKNYFRQVPLCWIENRPVYKGDVLYYVNYMPGGMFEVRGVESDDCLQGTSKFTDGAIPYGCELISALSWTKPVTKKKYWVNLYEDQKYGKYWQPHDDRERADNAATYSNGKVDINRIACVEIELPVKE